MKKLLLLLAFSCFAAHSQCLKGDCQNGQGTYQYDEGLFRGEFKQGVAYNGEFILKIFSKPIIFKGYFLDNEEGYPILDSTKKGEMIHYSGLEREGFITEIITIKDGGKVYNWELNGVGQKKSPTQAGGFQVEKGNFINDVLNDENATIIYSNGTKYSGGVVMGKRQGLGKEITPEGGIQQDGNWFDDKWIDENKNNPYAIPIFYTGTSIYVEVDFNGTKYPMVLDSGASNVVINKHIFDALLKLGQIIPKDSVDSSFEIANGDVITGTTYIIDKMKLGSFEITNIECSVLDNDNASNLLGLNALLAINKKFSVDVEALELTFY